ncbi:hypothetical protein [Okeania sp. SIO2B3]|uniref:hypothetical protein n=1 Tax=Okeania sp. SIO2B3 TaxID=2607784 RepID=UPI0013C0D699|nr:hypothetical protein [Okeania sp. SIO2B3]NET45151.1 hypothetical protein [Okeania sp. SIO2B3]
MTIVRRKNQLANAELERTQLKFLEAQRRHWLKSHIANQILLHKTDIKRHIATF